ncbi:MAG: metal ABC transporter permease, partial [Desulfuromonadales bacterium]|nr:metal ABC transporter permease [Desulfuromonadales bacterium]
MPTFEIFGYGFIQRALIAGTLIGLLCALLGLFLVLRRFSLIGDGLAHVTFGSVAIVLLVGISPLYITLAALPLVIISSLAILHLTRSKKIQGDAAIGIVSSIGIAVGIVLA